MKVTRAALENFKEAYAENDEFFGVNMAEERLESGQPIEWPNIVALNWAVTTLIRDAKSIIEIGSGTGAFAYFASVDSKRIIHCFEFDDYARNYAKKNRNRENVKYFGKYDGSLREEYDLLVSIEVIEHVKDLKGFLEFTSKLAKRAIYTTPNRKVLRGENDLGPPVKRTHVREFATGEIYWIFKLFYKKVRLFYMPDIYVPWLNVMDIATEGTPIVAECTESLFF